MWRDNGWYEPSRPREAKGGIKSQSRKGDFGASWWARRWIDVLESFDIGARLQRGRAYARKGQVLSIEVDKGIVSAKVQGSRARPYVVSIRVQHLSDAEWDMLIEVLASQAIFAAKLLAGEMPHDIEEVFSAAKLTLFPGKRKDLDTDCSCPDWSNPCKHIAAVFYLLGEEFDRDPFLIFKLRGMGREDLLERLRGTSGEPLDAPPAPEPLPTHISEFWNGKPVHEGLLGDVRVPPMPAALPERLGGFPFWSGEEPLLQALRPIYSTASEVGVNLVIGEQPNPTGPGKTRWPADNGAKPVSDGRRKRLA